jgi:excisionase family DNA binding protein
VSSPGAGAEYLRPGEAAKLLHVSPKTIDRWAADGRIPCIVTLGGHRRFRVGDVLAVAEQMERPVEPVTKGAKPDTPVKAAKPIKAAKTTKAAKTKGTPGKRQTGGQRRRRD